LRIAVVSPFVDRRHGTERALAEVLERFAGREGCEIHLYAQRAENLPLTYFELSAPRPACFIFWHRVPSIPGPHLVQFLAWLFLNSFLRAWDRAIHGLRFDLVLSPGINCFDADVVIVHALFCRLRQLSLEDQRDSPNLGLLQRLHRRAYYGLLAYLERKLYSDPKVTLAAVSQRTANLIQSNFHRHNVSVIPNGVNSAEFSPSERLARRAEARLHHKLQENDFVLLLIGNDWHTKGLPAVLNAMSARPDMPIHVIAAGSDSPGGYAERARQLGIAQRCHFVPPHPDVLDLYAAADLYASPSLEDSFGMPVAEAMACGLPVITSPFAGVSERVQDGVDGFVLGNPRDSQELSNLLEQLWRHPQERLRVGVAAAKSVSEWNWDRNSEAVWQLLQDALQKKRGTPLS
jgi:UDP-glucose:(heptosyl)LPS alpha-1,3-glucosyltransferase